MSSIRTFERGGIRVRGDGEQEEPVSIANAFLPNSAVVLLKQHAGAPARCVVRRGEYVREGMIVGRGLGPGSADVHAPVPGVVRDIRVVLLPEGGESEAVVIALEGSFDRLGRRAERYVWNSMGRADLLRTVRDRGVVDTEAPGVPLYDLLADRESTDALILNAVESEPYLRTESSLLKERAEQASDGLAILAKLTEPARIVVAVDERCDEASLRPWAGDARIEIVRFEARYPQDMRNQMLESILGARKRSNSSVLVVRPSTAVALHEAIVLAKPVMERYVTVGGGAIKRPAVLKVRIGTPIGDLIEECGGFLGPPARIVLGGPFRGFPVHDLDAPVTKTSSAVLALSEDEVGSAHRNPCIRCGRCASVCPEKLDPERLFRLLSHRRVAEAESWGLKDCTLCGACGYICPSRVQLVAAFAVRLRSGISKAMEARP
ncbi:MAG TPA: RnfABCDGE type electron transport complex subunit C [Rectinemataceae bacterium]|nr:RnfABCDGE type electron transport complex subunit C [Rectinemataceae bacterium]